MSIISIDEIIRSFPKRNPDAHKGDFGHALIIAGSTGYTGASYLASQAAMRAGSGLVTLAVPESIYAVMASKLTEVMVRPVVATKEGCFSVIAEKELLDFAKKCNALGIGPGLSQNKETARLVKSLITKIDSPIVLDADGINAFSGCADCLKKAKGALILTPHSGELSKLTGKSVEDIRKTRKDIALEVALEYNTVLVLKGQGTVVASSDGKVYVNQTGNPGMASGGVGDVLTGIITGFLAQGVECFNAAVLGAYFHGLAGDLALKDKGHLGLIATDLLEKLPEVLKVLD